MRYNVFVIDFDDNSYTLGEKISSSRIDKVCEKLMLQGLIVGNKCVRAKRVEWEPMLVKKGNIG